MRSNAVTIEASEVRLDDTTLAERQGLCADQPFADQPAAAECSGFLVDERTVLTAGHCVVDLPCEELRAVRSYFYEEAGVLAPIRLDDVYACAEVVVEAHSPPDAPVRLDYAFVRLDRPVQSVLPPPVLRDRREELAVDEPVTLLGFSQGLPLKIDQGGRVLEPRSDSLDYFVANVDAFGGDSGGAVLDAAGRLVGVVVRGSRDYVLTEARCNIASVRPDDGTAQEQSTYALAALDGLCRTHPRSTACGALAGDHPERKLEASVGCSVALRVTDDQGSASRVAGWLVALGAVAFLRCRPPWSRMSRPAFARRRSAAADSSCGRA
jgi:hypothetical protein